MPAAQLFEHDVTLTLSPRKSRRAFVCPDQAAPIPLSMPPISIPAAVAPTSVSTSLAPSTESEAKSEAQPKELAGLIPIYPNENPPAIVSLEVNPNGGYGRKYKAFYVVVRGRQTGVFYEYW
jgi:hypothetical protein